MALSVLLLGACSKGNDEGDRAAAPVTAATTSPAPTTTAPAPTTTEATTTTVDMRSVEVPPGAPPLPLYSGDPVLMTEALFEFLCWVDAHPLEAGNVADAYSVPGTEYNAKQSAELDRVISAGGLVVSHCLEVLDITPVATEATDPPLVMSLLTSSRPVAFETAPDGTTTPLSTWTRAETLIVFELQPSGAWLVRETTVRSKT